MTMKTFRLCASVLLAFAILGCGSESDNSTDTESPEESVQPEWRYEQSAPFASLLFHRDYDENGEEVGEQSVTLTLNGIRTTRSYGEDGTLYGISSKAFAESGWHEREDSDSFLDQPATARLTYELNGRHEHIEFTLTNATHIEGQVDTLVYHIADLSGPGLDHLRSQQRGDGACQTYESRVETCVIQFDYAYLFIDPSASDNPPLPALEQIQTPLRSTDGEDDGALGQRAFPLFDETCNPFTCVGAVSLILTAEIAISNPEVDAEVLALKLLTGQAKAQAIAAVCSAAGGIVQLVSGGSIKGTDVSRPCEASLRIVTNPLSEIVHILANLMCGKGFQP